MQFRHAIIVFSIAAFSMAGCASKRIGGAAALASSSPASPAGAGLGARHVPEAAPYAGPSGSSAVSQAEMSEFTNAVGDRVYFALDSYGLDNDARATLDRQARWLIARPNVRALIAGHADERGTREYNLALGSRRAAAARDFLVARGISANRIDTVSYGKERPVDNRATEEGWARNRNAHSALLNGGPIA